MIFLDDYIINKNKHKRYRYTCDICGKDRGYLQKTKRIGNLCVKCKNSKIPVYEGNNFCKHCNKVHPIPICGKTDEYWYWEERTMSLNGGYHRCQVSLKSKNEIWKKNNPIKYKEKNIRSSKKYRESIQGRIRSSVSSRMSFCLFSRSATKNKGSKFKYLDYILDDLIVHLEKQFKNNMSWKNYGEWHIDHITPDSWFNYSSTEDEEFKKSWALNNLQPLWAEDNLKKNNRYSGE